MTAKTTNPFSGDGGPKISVNDQYDDQWLTLTLRVGSFTRNTAATADGARRSIYIEHCRVVRASDGLEGLRNGYVTVGLYEPRSRQDDPEKIGALSMKRPHANVYLPHPAFQEFWVAALASDGATRDIQLELTGESVAGESLRVLRISLSEKIVASVDDNLMPSHKHPVIIEIEKMFQSAQKSLTWLFWWIVIIYVVTSVLHWNSHGLS